MAMALDTDPAALEKRTIYAFPLGFAVKKFDEEIEVWRNLEVRLTENGEIADVKDRVRPDILRSQAIVMEKFSEEKRPGGAKAPGYVLSKTNYLMTFRGGADFITRPSPVNFFEERKNLTRL